MVKSIWEQDLKIGISNKEWQAINKFNQKISVIVGIFENCYKVIHQWYFSPERLATMYPQMEDKCRCCGNAGPDFFPIFGRDVRWQLNCGIQ